jgi:hypothetical protein
MEALVQAQLRRARWLIMVLPLVALGAAVLAGK